MEWYDPLLQMASGWTDNCCASRNHIAITEKVLKLTQQIF